VTRFRIVPERSAVLIDATSSVHPIRTRTNGLEGSIEFDVKADGSIDIDAGVTGELSLAVDRLRSGSREETTDEELAADPDEDVLARIDEALDVHDAMAGLPENCREILDRFFARDESYRTIGDNLGLPAGTIASRISRCLDKLRDAFEGRNVPPAPSGGQVT